MGLSAPVQAETSVHAIGAVTVARSDNMLAVSDPPPEGQRKLPVIYIDLAPGLAFYWDQPRASHTFTFIHGFTYYVAHTSSNSQSDAATWASAFHLSPRDELSLGLTVVRSRANLAAMRADASTTPIQAQALQGSTLLTSNFREGYNRHLAPNWRLSQGASVGWVKPINVGTAQGDRYTVDGTLGLDYSFGRNSVGITGRGAYFYTESVTTDRGPTPEQKEITTGASVYYRRDLGGHFTGEVSAGAAGVMRATDFGGAVWGPTWGAALRYTTQGGNAALTYDHTVMPNLLTASIALVDRVGVAGGIPLSHIPDVRLSGSAGYSVSRTIDTLRGDITGSTRTLMADSSVAWFVRPNLNAMLRVQHTHQYGNDQFEQATPSFIQNVVMVTVGGMLPERTRPGTNTAAPVRVDRTDGQNLERLEQEQQRQREMQQRRHQTNPEEAGTGDRATESNSGQASGRVQADTP